MILKTFRFRLFILSVLSAMVVFLILILLVSSNFKKNFHECVDKDLIERASGLSSYTVGQPRLRQNEKIIEKVKNDYYQIINVGGNILVSSVATDHLWPINRDLMLKAFNGITGFETV